jgi:hypothetical protein
MFKGLAASARRFATIKNRKAKKPMITLFTVGLNLVKRKNGSTVGLPTVCRTRLDPANSQ